MKEAGCEIKEGMLMKITKVRLGRISVPLRVPFKTALRQVNSVEDIIVEIHTDSGEVGFGEAPPTGVITGDTTGAIIGAFQDHISKTLVGRDVDDFEDITRAVQDCIVKNSSAKAAADMALWDLYGKKYGVPVYKMAGGSPEQDHHGYHHQRESSGRNGPGCGGRHPAGL